MTQDGVKRVPFMISPRTIGLITLFDQGPDYLADLWAHDYIDHYAQGEAAARQFLDQLKEQWTPLFLMQLRKAITEKLAEHDQEFGTKFAEEKE